MRVAIADFCLLLAACLLAATAASAHAATTPAEPPIGAASAVALVVDIDGAIGPASADHVRRALRRAEREGVRVVVLRLDTPGGLDSAMRDIIKAILASPVPVAAFVAPQGARAASAGTYILYASHVAVMAPATNLGAATPVAVVVPGLPGREPARPERAGSAAADGDAMAAKRLNDAVAYIRGLALLHGRNAEWAERAVREAVSLTAGEALQQHVVDVIAADVPELLRRIDGRNVQVRNAAGDASAGATTGLSLRLATAGATVITQEPDARNRLLALVGDPSVALILMMIGIYGLLFEFMSPGFVLPGVVGGVCLLLGLYGLQTLPVNWAGLALLLLGIAFLVAEIFVPSFGVLGFGGIVAFAFGALMLFDRDVPGYGVPVELVVALTATSAVFLVGVVGMAVRARRRPQVAGAAVLAGASGRLLEVDATDARRGWAEIRGERWRVRGATVLAPGQRVRVANIDGLTLDVVPEPETDRPRFA